MSSWMITACIGVIAAPFVTPVEVVVLLLQHVALCRMCHATIDSASTLSASILLVNKWAAFILAASLFVLCPVGNSVGISAHVILLATQLSMFCTMCRNSAIDFHAVYAAGRMSSAHLSEFVTRTMSTMSTMSQGGGGGGSAGGGGGGGDQRPAMEAMARVIARQRSPTEGGAADDLCPICLEGVDFCGANQGADEPGKKENRRMRMHHLTDCATCRCVVHTSCMCQMVMVSSAKGIEPTCPCCRAPL